MISFYFTALIVSLFGQKCLPNECHVISMKLPTKRIFLIEKRSIRTHLRYLKVAKYDAKWITTRGKKALTVRKLCFPLTFITSTLVLAAQTARKARTSDAKFTIMFINGVWVCRGGGVRGGGGWGALFCPCSAQSVSQSSPHYHALPGPKSDPPSFFCPSAHASVPPSRRAVLTQQKKPCSGQIWGNSDSVMV